MKSLCGTFSITCPLHPQSDGLVEKTFRKIKLLLCAVLQDSDFSWIDAIPYIEIGLRCSNNSSSNFSPFEVVFGRKMNLLARNLKVINIPLRNVISN